VGSSAAGGPAGVAPAVVAPAGGSDAATGLGSGGGAVAAATFSSTQFPLVASLNSFDAWPSDRASFGSLLDPKTSKAITRMISSSGAPRSTMPPPHDRARQYVPPRVPAAETGR